MASTKLGTNTGTKPINTTMGKSTNAAQSASSKGGGKKAPKKSKGSY